MAVIKVETLRDESYRIVTGTAAINFPAVVPIYVFTCDFYRGVTMYFINGHVLAASYVDACGHYPAHVHLFVIYSPHHRDYSKISSGSDVFQALDKATNFLND